jgi:hypothetical protein
VPDIIVGHPFPLLIQGSRKGFASAGAAAGRGDTAGWVPVRWSAPPAPVNLLFYNEEPPTRIEVSVPWIRKECGKLPAPSRLETLRLALPLNSDRRFGASWSIRRCRAGDCFGGSRGLSSPLASSPSAA